MVGWVERGRCGFALRVEAQDFDLYAFADAQHVAGVADRGPADFADVEKAVGAADVDEGAERTQAAHLAFDDCAYGEFLEQLCFAAGPVFAFGQAVGEHKAAPLPFHFDDLDRQFLADDELEPLIALFFVHVARQTDDMRSRNEASQVVEVGQETSLIEADDFADCDFTALEHCFGDKPVFLLQGVGDAQHEHAFVGREFAYDHGHCFTLEHRVHIFGFEPVQVRLGHDAITLGANVHQQLVRAYFDHNAFPKITALGKAKVLFFGQILFKEHFIGLLLFTGILTGLNFSFVANLI